MLLELLLAVGKEKFNNKIVVVLFAVFIFCPAVWPDTITLKSGKTVHGTIRERDQDLILLDVGLDSPITYYSDEIANVVKDDKDHSSDATPVARKSNPKTDKADAIEHQGLAALDQGKMDKGLALLRQAVAMDPKANRHLNLGGILFGNGVALSKQGKKDEAQKTFRESEEEIQQAITMFDPDEETTLLSQAYYLLGEMYANAFNDRSKAKEFYEKSLSFYPNPKAQEGLDALK